MVTVRNLKQAAQSVFSWQCEKTKAEYNTYRILTNLLEPILCSLPCSIKETEPMAKLCFSTLQD